MAQINWVLLQDHGRQHSIGLYHGDQSGHLLIHCNMKIIQIDFSIKETRTYSFFVEEEFVEILLYKEPDGRFSYQFIVNKEVDTPLNRVRRVEEKKNLKHLWLFVAGFVGLLTLIFFILRWYGDQQEAKSYATTSIVHGVNKEMRERLGREGVVVPAKIIIVHTPQKQRVYYTFVTKDRYRYSGTYAVPDTGNIMLPTGFPLLDGDVFQAHYLPSDPAVHRIDLHQPINSTIVNYVQQALKSELAAHPDYTPKRAMCGIQAALEFEGWPCLADYIFQSQGSEIHKASYWRLQRNPQFEKIIQERCVFD